MKIYKVLSFFILITVIGVTIMETNAQNNSTLNYKIYRANENSFHVASVLLSGKNDAVLVDAQFTRADAHRVVADILESKKNLKTIYISHGDPDYYFGLEVLLEVFPDVSVYATEPTVKHIQQTYQKKLKYWGGILGSNGTKNAVIPRILEGNTIDLEEHKLEIKGLNGSTPKRSYVWIPSLKMVVGGVNIYDNLHLFVADAGTKKERVAWMNVLNDIEALQPEIVIAAHALNDDNINTRKAIAYSKEYLEAYETEVAKAKDSKELIKAMQKLYPNSGSQISLDLGAKVAKGEMKW